jgi:hypothetical protein
MGVGGVMGDIGGISYDIIVNDLTKAGTDSAIQNLGRVEQQADRATISLRQIATAFAALTAASATAVMASDRVVALERNTAHAAVTQGATTRAMYEYVQGLSSASDSQEEIGATMNYLSRTGLRMADDLTSVYKTMDLIGDSVGESSTAIAQQLIPAFQSLGLTSKDIAQYADLFAYAVNNSLMDVSTWSMFVRRYSDQMITYKVQVGDTIAIMERMSQLGVPQRKIMSMMGEAFREMGASAEAAAKGEGELLEIQKRLNDSQREGSNISRDYAEDLQAAGGDVSEIRSLTMSYNRRMRDRSEETARLQREADAKRAEIDAAKSAPQVDIITSLAKAYPSLFSEESLREAVRTTTDKSKGAAAAYSPAGGISTGSEMAAYDMDQLMQNTLGKSIDSNVAKNMVYLRDISMAMTAVTGFLALIEGFSKTTSIMTTASAVGGGIGAPAILAGMGIGLAGVGLMEYTGVTNFDNDPEHGRGIIGQAGYDYAGAWRDTNAKSPKLYAEGGLVPGPVGEPQSAIVHGGEVIIPVGRTVGDTLGGGFGNYGTGDPIAAIVDAISGIASGVSITIQNVTLSKDYDFQKMVRDMEAYQSTKRKQMGVRTS